MLLETLDFSNRFEPLTKDVTIPPLVSKRESHIVEVIYHLSSVLLVLCFLGLPILIVILLIKPNILNDKSFIKKPFSRGKILGIGVLVFLVSMFSFGGIVAATEPEYIKQERNARQLSEERSLNEPKLEEAQKSVVKLESKTESVAFETIEQQDGTIPQGEKRVATEGSNGERTVTHEVTYQDNNELSRKEIKNEITKQPTTKIVKVGTYVAPASSPQPAPSVYYKDCSAVRNAGAAPIYRGQPGYGTHLDRDKDGVGCE